MQPETLKLPQRRIKMHFPAPIFPEISVGAYLRPPSRFRAPALRHRVDSAVFMCDDHSFRVANVVITTPRHLQHTNATKHLKSSENMQFKSCFTYR